MKRTLPVVALIIAALFAALPDQVRAQAGHDHTHMHESADQLGRVNFAVSCNPPARKQFNRAVAWLHSFEYEEAEKAFTEVAALDKSCGMAYWGIAMSHYHTIWTPPSAAELQQGASALANAKTAGLRTQRERDYVTALAAFFENYDKSDHRTRTEAYSTAMEQLYRRYPADDEAAVFYALTLIARGMMVHDKRYANEKEAARILNRVLARQPQHPGVTHYLIHSYDSPSLAKFALPAARRYAKVAPASSHAQHMPSHIFTRLGLWPEGILSNLDAEASAKAFAVRNHWAGVWDEQLHAMDYLAYAYLQGAQDEHARGVLLELNQIQKVVPETFKVAYAAAAIPARYALERRRWNEAAKLTLPAGYWTTFPWQKFRWAEAHIHFARAVGAARSGDATAARQEVAQLAKIKDQLAGVKGDYDWATQVDIERFVASAWLAYAEGNHEEALRVMLEAANIDDATDKHPVTPGAILPAREQLGELLLELKQPAAAMKEFEASLRNAPNRFNGLYGAARAARLAGDHTNAKLYYGKLMVLSRNAEGKRPEIEEAKAFLAGVKLKDYASLHPGP